MYILTKYLQSHDIRAKDEIGKSIYKVKVPQ